MDKKVTNIDITALKSRLEWGDMTKIAKKINRSEQSVCQHLSGQTKSVSPQIIRAALDILDEREKTISKLNKRINK